MEKPEKRKKNTKMGCKRKKITTYETCSIALLGNTDTIFPLLLATLCNHRNRPDSQSLVKKCLTKLHACLFSKSLNPSLFPQPTLPVSILSLLPILLSSKCTEIACLSAKIVGAASLLSFEMNERIALDGEIVRVLIWAVGSSSRRVSMAACNALLDLSTTSIGRQRLLEFSALERLLWAGFAHVALYHWSQTKKQPDHTLFDPLAGILNVIAVKLLHVMIELIGASDPTFRKACLVGALSLPLDRKDWLYFNQKTIFNYLVSKISMESRILEALRILEVAIERKEDIQGMKWLQLLNNEKETIQGYDWTASFMEIENLYSIYVQHQDLAEAAFVHIKTKFCDEVSFEDMIDSYKMLFEKYKKARKQYMNGMLSLHRN